MTKNTQKTASYTSVDIKKLPQSEVEITASVSAEILETYRTQALKNINNTITIDGFRKGNVPENILVAKVGDMAILEEMSELALSKAYMDIIIDNKIDAIGRPRVNVTKLAKGNPVEFKIVTAVVPEIKLPDYKKIAQAEIKKNDPKDLEVTPQDIEDSILRIRKSKASHEGHDHENPPAGGDSEEHDKAIEASMPELTDDFVKTLGDFTDVPDFKNKLSDMIAENKRDQAREKTRIRIADAIAEKTTVEIPDLMIESELERTQAQFSADVERMGVRLEDYLKHAKKTLDEVKKEWRPHAEKKARLQLILNEIARLEKIHPSTEEIEGEINHIVEHYKDADRERVGTYAETVLTNEKVFAWLESEEK
ncbi:MAG: trigger factor [Candidatus Taylorbacteria bacterium]